MTDAMLDEWVCPKCRYVNRWFQEKCVNCDYVKDKGRQ